jgi:indole-3-glycerol phosphate synthase/phosphoribosylanthranilate isomerase
MKYLKEILVNKKKEINPAEHDNLIKALKNVENDERMPGRFVSGIRKNSLNIIAEIKRASPSKGTLKEDLDIEKIVGTYNRFSDIISGISVITEEIYFRGSKSFISEVKKFTGFPVLRKDFIFHPLQVAESAMLGADCILLISSIMSGKKLKLLCSFARELKLDVLVETHTERDFQKAVDAGAEFIGINNRNLKTMEVDPDNTPKILEFAGKQVMDEKIIVCESGLDSAGAIRKIQAFGINTFLIGSHLMQGSNLVEKLEELRFCKNSGVRVKICGITNPADALDAFRAGADVLGLILSTDSPRRVDLKEAIRIIEAVRSDISGKNFPADTGADNSAPGSKDQYGASFAGVFVNESSGCIKKYLDTGLFDFAQFSGDEDIAFISEIKRQFPGVKTIRSIKIKKDDKREDIYKKINSFYVSSDCGPVDYFLLETFDPIQYGGTGYAFDWKIIENIGKKYPVMLAGGLGPSNVLEAIKIIRPYGVDCSSGVELYKGKKDINKMTEFVKNARSI